jgi:hypothetical protein
MDLTGLLPPSVETNRDRFDLVESLSGWKFDDTLRGDDRVAADMDGHELTAEGIARVDGMSALLNGATSFTGGNIIMGGDGADLIEGRGGDDLIDGDAWLDVQLRAPDLVNGGTKLVDDMSSLRADVFAGRINPGAISIVRSIKQGAAGTDTALFSGPRADYDIAVGANGTTVTHARGTATDGQDRLRSVERLQFSDQTVTVAAPSAPTIGTAATTATQGSVNVAFTPAAGGAAATSFTIQVKQAGAVVRTVTVDSATATSGVVTGLAPGTYTFAVSAVNQFGASPFSADSNAVTVNAPTVAPSAPTALTATRGNASASLTWTLGANGGSPLTGYTLQVRIGTTVVRTQNIGTARPFNVTGLTNGVAYNFRLQARNAVGTSPLSAPSNTVTPATVPGQTRILAPTRGAPGGALTAAANWNAPVSNGGAAITSYQVRALRMAANGTTVVGTPVTRTVAGTVRSASFTLPAGNYRFDVRAINAVGAGALSARSALVAPR